MRDEQVAERIARIREFYEVSNQPDKLEEFNRRLIDLPRMRIQVVRAYEIDQMGGTLDAQDGRSYR